MEREKKGGIMNRRKLHEPRGWKEVGGEGGNQDAGTLSKQKEEKKKLEESSICAATANLIRGLMTFVKYYI